MDGFTFFKSYYESAQHLNNKDQALFYKMIMDYMFTGQEPQIEGHLMGFWLLIKPNLDTSKKRAKSGQKQIKTKSKTNQNEIKSKSKRNQNEIKTKSKSEPSPLEDKDKDKDKDKGVGVGVGVGSKEHPPSEKYVPLDGLRVSNYLLEKIRSIQPNFKQPNIKSWAVEIDRAIRIDNRNVDALIGCIDWIYSEHGKFWIPNIKSAKKLREKFDTMEGQMMSRRKSNNGLDAMLEVYNAS